MVSSFLIDMSAIVYDLISAEEMSLHFFPYKIYLEPGIDK